MTASWEQIARILQAEEVSDAELSGRLDCKPQFVARVRADLQMPPLPWPLPAPPPEDPRLGCQIERFAQLSEPVLDGHRQWRGKRTVADGTPLWNSKVTAARKAFEFHHGRKPVGIVRVECEMEHCVEGQHLSDKPMREQAQELM